MIEVFKYTERIVSMVRPRKLLFMAIGMLNLLDLAASMYVMTFSQTVLHREQK